MKIKNITTSLRQCFYMALFAVLALASAVQGAPLNIALFDNSSFVDTGGTSYNESDTVQAVYSGAGHTVTLFTGITDTDFAAALAEKQVLVIPELELGNLNSALSSAARTVIANFVNSGGVFVIHADYSSNHTLLLNGVFGFAITGGGDPYNLALNVAAAAGTSFSSGPATLPNLSATVALATSSLPVGSKSIYTDSVSANMTGVALIPYGAGRVVYLGWDAFDCAPLGSQDGGWVATFRNAVLAGANYIYFADYSGKVGRYDPATNAITTVGTLSASGFGVSDIVGLAFDPAANRIIITDRAAGKAYSMNPDTGAATLLFSFSSYALQGAAVKNGLLYGVHEDEQRLTAYTMAGVLQTLPAAVGGNLGHSHGLGLEVGTNKLVAADYNTNTFIYVNDDGSVAGQITPAFGAQDLDGY